jgi:hypothetical protein
LQEEKPGVYVAKLVAPTSGWTASFIELTYDVGQTFPLKVTTAVKVLPDKLPFADLDPADAPLEDRRREKAGQ